MGLIDHSILQQAGPNVLGNVPTLGAMREASRKRAATDAFRKAAQGKDITTVEGMRAAITGLADAGFADEAQKVFAAHADLFKAPAAAKSGTWQSLPGAATPTLYNDLTGDTKATGVGAKTAEGKVKSYQPVKAKGGKIVGWDPTTGLGPDGKPVEFYEEPRSPKPDGIKPENVFSMEQKLSNDFRAVAGKSIDVATANAKISEALSQNNPLDAYNAIVQFVKIIDPGTAAREGEVKSAVLSASGGAGARLAQAAKMAYNGTLDAETIKNIKESAAALVRGEKKTFDFHRKFFKSKIDSYNKRGFQLDENAILGDYDGLFGDSALATPSAPPVADPRRAMAQQAMNDPEATPEEKAQAKKILGIP